MASGLFLILPSAGSKWSSRLTSQATFESCSIVTATLPLRNRLMQLFALLNSGDEVGKVRVGHGVATDEVGRAGCGPA